MSASSGHGSHTSLTSALSDFVSLSQSLASNVMVWVSLDSDGRYVDFAADLVKLPSEEFEDFYRFLLTLNDDATGPCRLSLRRDVVQLSHSEPTSFLNPTEVVDSLERMMALSTALTEMFREGFDVAPAASRWNEYWGELA